MKATILFDIDRVLFDTDSFISTYQKKFLKYLDITPSKLNQILTKYQHSLAKHTDYSPEELIKHLINSLHKDKQSEIYKKLRAIFYAKDNFSQNLFPETTNSLSLLKTRYQLGIFSEGQPAYQKAKLVKSGLYDFFNPKLLFLEKRKLTEEVLSTLPENSTVVDDDIKVIQNLLDQKFKTLSPIWLNRKNSTVHPHIKTIHSLLDLL